MRIDDLEWDDWNIEHIARHGVDQDEVHEACGSGSHLVRKAGKTKRGQVRYHVYGQTFEGRYLFIVLDRRHGATFYVVTARDMSSTEKKMYRKERR